MQRLKGMVARKNGSTTVQLIQLGWENQGNDRSGSPRSTGGVVPSAEIAGGSFLAAFFLKLGKRRKLQLRKVRPTNAKTIIAVNPAKTAALLCRVRDPWTTNRGRRSKLESAETSIKRLRSRFLA
jgi:hypothetical protein